MAWAILVSSAARPRKCVGKAKSRNANGENCIVKHDGLTIEYMNEHCILLWLANATCVIAWIGFIYFGHKECWVRSDFHQVSFHARLDESERKKSLAGFRLYRRRVRGNIVKLIGNIFWIKVERWMNFICWFIDNCRTKTHSPCSHEKFDFFSSHDNVLIEFPRSIRSFFSPYSAPRHVIIQYRVVIMYPVHHRWHHWNMSNNTCQLNCWVDFIIFIE